MSCIFNLYFEVIDATYNVGKSIVASTFLSIPTKAAAKSFLIDLSDASRCPILVESGRTL